MFCNSTLEVKEAAELIKAVAQELNEDDDKIDVLEVFKNGDRFDKDGEAANRRTVEGDNEGH